MLNRMAVSCLMAMTISTPVLAGQLAPPAGPVQATRTIPLHPQDLTFPHLITDSGHYVLTGHVDVPAGVDGFHIQAHLVTLDLGGFRINTADPDDPATAIVGLLPVLNGIVIRNGSFADWPSGAINLLNARLSTVENVTVIGVGAGDGILLGNECVVDDCRVTDCSLVGIITGSGCTVRDTIVSNCNNRGIAVGNGSMVLHCSSIDNTGDGIVASASCLIDSCIAVGNGSAGIVAVSKSVIRGCISSQNTIVGMRMRLGGSIVDCLITDELGIGALVEGEMLRCAVLGTGGKGVSIDGVGGRVIDTRVEDSQFEGIELFWRGEVINCEVRNCRREGIVARSGADFSRIIGNSLFVNGTDNSGVVPPAGLFGGIHIVPLANDCLVDCNSLVLNDAGIVIPMGAVRTTVIRNHAKFNNVTSLGLLNYEIDDVPAQDLTLLHTSYTTAGPYDNIDK